MGEANLPRASLSPQMILSIIFNYIKISTKARKSAKDTEKRDFCRRERRGRRDFYLCLLCAPVAKNRP